MKSSLFAIALLLPGLACAKFTVKSSSFKGVKMIPEEHAFNGFGCKGENVSPALEWSGAPKETRSFAVTVFDPDAPTGSGWWHWTIVNIPPTVTKIEEGTVPEGATEGRTDYGKPGWGGPCPPKGETHNYVFTVHALKTDKLDITPESSGASVGFMVNANSIGSAKMTIKYSR